MTPVVVGVEYPGIADVPLLLLTETLSEGGAGEALKREEEKMYCVTGIRVSTLIPFTLTALHRRNPSSFKGIWSRKAGISVVYENVFFFLLSMFQNSPPPTHTLHRK